MIVGCGGTLAGSSAPASYSSQANASIKVLDNQLWVTDRDFVHKFCNTELFPFRFRLQSTAKRTY